MDHPAPARLCSTVLVASLVAGFLGCLLMGAVASDLPGTPLARWLDPAAPAALPRVYAAALAVAVVLAVRELVAAGRRRWAVLGVGSVLVVLAVPASPTVVSTGTVVVLGALVSALALLDARSVDLGPGPVRSEVRTLLVRAG